MTTDELLAPLAELRTDEIVVTTMSVVRPWGALSSHDLDLASSDSAMGHTADLALGLAMARPERNVICLNGDGSMLMTLGTIATAIAAGVTNYVLVIVNNGTYEITGNQPIPGSEAIDFAGIARAAGWPETHSFVAGDDYRTALPALLGRSGPVLISVDVDTGSQGPIGRGAHETSRYLKVSLSDWAWQMRNYLQS